MKFLILINDAPYGSEKAYNALRLAMALQKDPSETEINIFLMADSVGCSLPNQKTPDGYYNIERMLKSVINKGAKVKACGSCMEARGLYGLELTAGVEISNMAELAEWSVQADKSFTF